MRTSIETILNKKVTLRRPSPTDITTHDIDPQAIVIVGSRGKILGQFINSRVYDADGNFFEENFG